MIIENNIIKNNRFGIALLAGGINAYINNNIIDSNNTQGNPNLGGSGLNFAGNWSTSSVIATRNTIRWNLWGVTIQNTAKPNLGNLQNQDTTDIGLNIIYGNGNTGVIYDLYNNTPDSIKAENNYWGTMNPDSVEAHIFHKPDNPALGFVDYLPLGLPTGIIKNHISVTGYEMLEIYPNPFNPEVIIKFRINTAGAINLKIYDLLGREVRTLLNNNLSPGEYEQTWNPTGLSSGVYIIRLATKENTFSQMISFVM